MPKKIILALLVTLSVAAHAADALRMVSVPSGEIAPALQRLAQQIGVEFFYSVDDLKGVRTKGVSGKYTTEQAIARLLEGTNLKLSVHQSGAYLISEPKPTAALKQEQESGPGMTLAQVGPEAVAKAARAADKTADESDSKNIGEVVVTGTNIVGVAPTSPVILIDEESIRRSGYASVRELFQTLPQNSGGAFNENSNPSPSPFSSGNVGTASTLDLRGFGPGSTLTLVNGRRLAPIGFLSGVDYTVIPLSAIDRVEVLTEGASAIYGSDAVAGVVNFVMKDRLDGAQTVLQVGSVTSGGVREARAAQTMGTSWATGSILASYEYYKRDPLLAEDRSFSSTLTPPEYLTPDQTRHTLLLHLSQSLGERTTFYVDALGGKQEKTLSSSANPPYEYWGKDEIDTLSGSAGVSVSLFKGWTAQLDGQYGLNREDQYSVYRRTGTRYFDQYDNDVLSFDAKISGTLFSLPGGAVSMALGAMARAESMKLISSNESIERDVRAGFAEIMVPLVGDANAMRGVRRLDLNVAARSEKYSDFGSSTDPKIGVAWEVVEGLKFRSTWSTSYRAPTLYNIGSNTTAYIFDVPDPTSTTGVTRALVPYGGNPGLKPETSRNWTFGVDFTRAELAGLRTSVTYYRTTFEDRIQMLTTNIYDYLQQEALYGVAVTRNPSLDSVQSFLANADRVSSTVGAFDPADIRAIVDVRMRNVASYDLDGLDVMLSQGFDTRFGRFGWELNWAHIFNLSQTVTAAQPKIPLVDRVFYNTSNRVRGGMNWSGNVWNSAVFLNYAGAYNNDTVSPVEEISSYLTADLQVGYNVSSSSSLFEGVDLSFSVRNLFDQKPPHVTSPSYYGGAQYGFDPANADPIGRFVSLTLRKSW